MHYNLDFIRVLSVRANQCLRLMTWTYPPAGSRVQTSDDADAAVQQDNFWNNEWACWWLAHKQENTNRVWRRWVIFTRHDLFQLERWRDLRVSGCVHWRWNSPVQAKVTYSIMYKHLQEFVCSTHTSPLGQTIYKIPIFVKPSDPETLLMCAACVSTQTQKIVWFSGDAPECICGRGLKQLDVPSNHSFPSQMWSRK